MSEILNSGTVRVEVEGSWYDLRQQIGWYQLEATSQLSAIRLGLPVSIARNLSNLGDLDPETPVTIEIINHERDLQRLTDRLAGWSYKTALREANIKRLPPSHVEAILETIGQLEQAEREGLAKLSDDHPFDKP